jgi:hypothetical protein
MHFEITSKEFIRLFEWAPSAGYRAQTPKEDKRARGIEQKSGPSDENSSGERGQGGTSEEQVFKGRLLGTENEAY